MPYKARQGDSISHGGQISVPTQTSVFCNGALVARVSDPVMCGQHGSQTISSGSLSVMCVGKAVARIGDLISCGATITSGSTNVMAG